MKLEITHRKNPASGWDISASAHAEGSEKIARARVNLNGFDLVDESFSEPVGTWQHELTQQGQYPGDNRVSVSVTDQNGNETSDEDSW